MTVCDTNRAKRPVSVWIVAIVFLLFATAGAWMAFRSAISYRHFLPEHIVGIVLFPMAKIGTVTMTAVGLFCRWRWSRWAAVAVLAVWPGLLVRNQIIEFLSTPVADAMAVDPYSAGYRAGQAIGMFAFSVVIVWTAGVIGFSQPSKDYFRSGGKKAAEPGATDNPDDAQRLREDH